MKASHTSDATQAEFSDLLAAAIAPHAAASPPEKKCKSRNDMKKCTPSKKKPVNRRKVKYWPAKDWTALINALRPILEFYAWPTAAVMIVALNPDGASMFFLSAAAKDFIMKIFKRD